MSFNQEARRVGLGGGIAGWWTSCRSPSSSELARASESGVDRRPLNLSSRREGLLEVIGVGFDWLVLIPVTPALLLVELMTTN